MIVKVRASDIIKILKEYNVEFVNIEENIPENKISIYKYRDENTEKKKSEEEDFDINKLIG